MGMRTGSRASVNKRGDSNTSWTQPADEVWEGCWKDELCREGVQVGPPQVRGLQRAPFLQRWLRSRGSRVSVSSGGGYQVSPFRNGTRQWMLMLPRLWRQWSSTRANCVPPSTSEKSYHYNSSPSRRSGHDVREYQFGTSGLQPMYRHKTRGKIEYKSRKIMIFRQKTVIKETRGVVWWPHRRVRWFACLQDCWITTTVHIADRCQHPLRLPLFEILSFVKINIL